MRLASLMAKLQDIREYCESQADGCLETELVPSTKAAYDEGIALIEARVANYYSSAFNSSRERQLTELIMTLYQTTTLSYLTSSSSAIPLVSIDESTAP